MGGSIACFVVMSVAGRAATAELPVLLVMELRSVIGFIMLLPLVFAAGGLAAMRTPRPLTHLGRNVAHYGGQYAWLVALGLIPLAELVAIEFTTPFWTALLAVLFLGERLDWRKVLAVLLGFGGVAVIVRPGGSAIDPGHLIMLAGAVTFGVSVVMVKSLTRTESVVRIIFWMLVIQSVIGLAPAIALWQPVPAHLWPAVLVVSFAGTFSHFCLARALAHADATTVMPMDFLRLPLTALVGWTAYGERIDTATALGAALILTGNLATLTRRKTAPLTDNP
ncbi:MAG TPA: DMT family transporter [Mesorhizobium sp.]|nr:DMT family transporter [Mesorhizobium sp.]